MNEGKMFGKDAKMEKKKKTNNETKENNEKETKII